MEIKNDNKYFMLDYIFIQQRKSMMFIKKLTLLTMFFLFTPAIFADAASEVIAITKAQWAKGIADAPVSEQSAIWADDYTLFGFGSPYRSNGKAMNVRRAEAFTADKGKGLSAEMVNEKVQVYGNTAILSYNYLGIGQDKDGEVSPNNAKSTRVYVKMKGKWKLVHAHFSPAASDN